MARTFYVDRRSKTIVDHNGGDVVLAPFYQTNYDALTIGVVTPSGNIDPWTEVDASASGLRVILSSKATGTLGDADEFTLAKTVQGGWTWNSSTKTFSGTLALNTDEVEAFLGGAAEKKALFEISLVTGGLYETLLQVEVLLRANADEATSTVPVVPDATSGILVLADATTAGITVTRTANLVAVSGFNWATAPGFVRIDFMIPDGTVGMLTANVLSGSLSTTGFSFILSGLPDTDTYQFRYQLDF